MAGTISQSELCWVALTNQIHINVVGKISHSGMVVQSCGGAVAQWHGGVVAWWHGDAVIGKSHAVMW